jgi:tetratricopeptide (TPR) repeat protein
MNCWRATLLTSVLLALSLPCYAQSGSVTVVIENEDGGAISAARVTAVPLNGPAAVYEGRWVGRGWVLRDLVAGMQYLVSVEAPGFVPAHQYVYLPGMTNVTESIEFYLVPTGREEGPAKPTAEAILAPRAQKEVQKGIKDLQANKIESAQKHLAKALKMAPGNPLVNYLVGESWLQAGKMDEATRYLEKAISLDPKQTQALTALGKVRLEQGNTGKAIELLKQAVESAPQSWPAHWLLASAYLSEENYRQAKEQAESAVKDGKGHADAATVIVGVALANLGKRDKALKTLNDYLKRHPTDPRAEQIRGFIAKLHQLPQEAQAAAPAEAEPPQTSIGAVGATTAGKAPGASEPTPNVAAAPVVAATSMAPPPPATVPAKQSWVPPDVDEEKLERVSDAACPLPQILRRTSKHAEELVSNLEKFTATEDFEEAEVGQSGSLIQPVELHLSYLVFIQHVRPHLFNIEEMRTPDPSIRLTAEPLTSRGSAALALVFHPVFVNDFDWKCEGMGEWKGQLAWLIHFQQRADRPTSNLIGLVTRSRGDYLLALKGRAWVAANGNQVLHLETDLVQPLEQVRLEQQHFAIDYRLVKFRTRQVALWLPERVDAFYKYRGHSYHQYSRFSNFKLFWVGTGQKIGEPEQKEGEH